MTLTAPHSRRAFVERAARACLGVTVGGAFASRTVASDAAPEAKADGVIYLFMKGGMSHLDTFDLKPDKPVAQGPTAGIATSVPGVRVTSELPKTAEQMHRLAQVRGVYHTLGNHAPGQYLMYTGYPAERGVLTHPSINAWTSKLSGEGAGTLPGSIRVGSLAGHPAQGFFEVASAPLPISDPTKGLQNSRRPPAVDEARFETRRRLLGRLNAAHRAGSGGAVDAYADLYEDAVRLMKSDDLAAFDLSKEPKEVRARYGGGAFGQGCLLARRLTAAGVRFVEVELDGWDSHVDNHRQVAEQCGKLDGPLAALLEDLAASGRLDRTLVVLATEFGRSPYIDENAGRNHHPFGFTCLLAGAGITGGAVYGSTDATGARVADGQVEFRDLNATICDALGLPWDEYHAPFPGGQEFSVAGKKTQPEKGEPIRALWG